ncbi:MAG: LuxR C-terminal-related transcriptional regulator [Candidatus Promineifilaceae bacterium]
MVDLLLSTKLYLPKAHSEFISRPHLIEQLNNGLNGRFTLLSAPAGFGKTSLLAAWIESLKGGRAADKPVPDLLLSKVAWLSLDAQDNDPNRFWHYLIAALQRVDSGLGQTAVPRLQSSHSLQTDTMLMMLINDLGKLEGRLGLFLDDYHLISNPAIHSALTYLLDYAPPQLHLVIAGRSDPPLGLSGWRVQCELNEIRAGDLRFTVGESRKFFHQVLGEPLPETSLKMLVERTEGWPAGLQLAALSLRDLNLSEAADFVAAFNGTNRHVFSYLVEEVFQRQSAVVQEFLLETTLLERLTAPLCNAVTRIESWETQNEEPEAAPPIPLRSQPVLEYLAQNNLFLMPLDENGQWYRYHPLFAETLQARLLQQQPEMIPELHRRAGEWYAANGFTEQAIQHALVANEPEMAADMIEAEANLFLSQGHLNVLLRWLEMLPEELLAKRLTLGLLFAWLLFLHDRWTEASKRVHLIGQQMADLDPDEAETQRYQGRWAAIQGAMAAHRQESANAISWMESALAQLPQEEILWRQVAMIGLGLAQLAEGEAASAVDTLHRSASICEEWGDIYLAFASWWHKMVACWAQGSLRQAGECLRRLEGLAERDEGDWLALKSNAAVGWGMLAYERNDLEEAKRLITAALPQIWPGGQPRVVLQGYLTLARTALTQGDKSCLGENLASAERLVRRFNLTAENRLLAVVMARQYLAQGMLLEAYWELENQQIGPESPVSFRNEAGLLTLVRIYLVEGRPNEALGILGRLLAAAELAGRSGSLIEISILQALALAKNQQPDRALSSLNRALALAEPEQFGRIFINEGRPMALLLERLSTSNPYAAHLLEQMEQAVVDLLPDPLTDRELEILSLVAAGASNQAIADQLFLSLGTVKGHLNHILGKLGVKNRTAAVARARDLELIA